MAAGRKTGGRQKGVSNRTTGLLKDAILKAADAVGEDGEGKGKLVGYLKTLARDEKRSFAGLLGRVMPLQVTGENGGAVQITLTGNDSAVL